MTAFTSEATRGVHTAVFTAMVTLAFIDVCINTGVATDGHRHNAMHIIHRWWCTHHCMSAGLNLTCNLGYSCICVMLQILYMNAGRKQLHMHLRLVVCSYKLHVTNIYVLIVRQ